MNFVGLVRSDYVRQQLGPHYCQETAFPSELSGVDRRCGNHTVRGPGCNDDVEEPPIEIAVTMFSTHSPLSGQALSCKMITPPDIMPHTSVVLFILFLSSSKVAQHMQH
ncbi:hypothetical protein TNCV_3037641 [Trichonephila clavipes]|nr:hypothetical protein TNCV_3037641 [Trichonephila clavipes]